MRTPVIPDSFYRLIDEDNLPRLSGISPLPEACLKSCPEDFRVEEIPAFEPSGEGNYLFVSIEKRDVDARNLVRSIAKALEIPPSDIGSAGMKDKNAITRQTLSFPARVENSLKRIDELDGIRILQVHRHHHHLKTGKLRGNRFSIFLRGTGFQAKQTQEITERLQKEGVGNFYGSQRFGRRGQTVAEGWRLVRGEATSPPRNKGMRRLMLNAVQSLVFSRYVERRLEAGLREQAVAGDVLQKTESGGLFLCENPEVDTERIHQGEIIPTGPLFGRKDRWVKGPERPLEDEIWGESGLPDGAFEPFGKLALGSRRAVTVFPVDLATTVEEEGLRLSFALPAGSYATVVAREFYTDESS